MDNVSRCENTPQRRPQAVISPRRRRPQKKKKQVQKVGIHSAHKPPTTLSEADSPRQA